jgi:hypothetical protein
MPTKFAKKGPDVAELHQNVGYRAKKFLRAGKTLAPPVTPIQ